MTTTDITFVLLLDDLAVLVEQTREKTYPEAAVRALKNARADFGMATVSEQTFDVILTIAREAGADDIADDLEEQYL